MRKKYFSGLPYSEEDYQKGSERLSDTVSLPEDFVSLDKQKEILKNMKELMAQHYFLISNKKHPLKHKVSWFALCVLIASVFGPVYFINIEYRFVGFDTLEAIYFFIGLILIKIYFSGSYNYAHLAKDLVKQCVAINNGWLYDSKVNYSKGRDLNAEFPEVFYHGNHPDFQQYKGKLDMVFTSPPYFSTETYNKGGENEEDQSWFKFNEYNKWRDDFFLPVSQKTFDSLSDTGHMLLNIMNPTIKGKMYPSCDEVCDLLRKDFKGQLGMRIMQRPQSSKTFLDKWTDVKGTDDSEQVSDKEGIDRTAMQDFMKKYYMENVWYFAKEDKDLFLPARRGQLDSFFV